ncbi:MAG: hypothetical protein R3E79_53220 [Caldilineaceae bacterium]
MDNSYLIQKNAEVPEEISIFRYEQDALFGVRLYGVTDTSEGRGSPLQSEGGTATRYKERRHQLGNLFYTENELQFIPNPACRCSEGDYSTTFSNAQEAIFASQSCRN